MCGQPAPGDGRGREEQTDIVITPKKSTAFLTKYGKYAIMVYIIRKRLVHLYFLSPRLLRNSPVLSVRTCDTVIILYFKGDKNMEVINTIVECGEYAVISNIDADVDLNNPKVINGKHLTCSLTEHIDLSKRDMTELVHPSLLKSFDAACKGTDKRWHLEVVLINGKGHLFFEFSDAQATNSALSGSRNNKQRVTFSNFDGTFYIYADRPGNDVPDEYCFQTDGGDGSFDEDGERVVMHIEEKRNGEWHSIKTFIQHKDGKCYLRKHIYD